MNTVTKKDRARVPCTMNASVGTLTWTFPTKGALVFHVERANAALRERAVFHGFQQKCADSMALDAAEFGGRVPESAKYDALAGMIAHLESGTADWNRRGEGRQTGDRTVLRMVLERLGKKLKVGIEELDAKQVAALLARPDFAEVVAAVRGEMTANVDTDGLLDDFEE